MGGKLCANLQCDQKSIFFVTVIHDSLPTQFNLARRGVIRDSRCKQCGGVESTLHALFWCIATTAVWKQVGWWSLVKPFLLQVDMKGVLIWLVKGRSHLALDMVGWVVWVVWR
ncbi:uncharacterized protein Fot_04230 [Forsythia ovata]|uniref:Reverse transcriptase zinc-binding domain-containing protein n=1 Tax=Forsythia ovata TaxID=205694 RepID=A0ABD1XCK1_9LAMI